MVRGVTKGEKTKAAIVRAAILILGRDGPDGFSAAAIAREAGMSKSNVFHHFTRIDEIPLAAFEELGAELYGAAAMSGRSMEAWLPALGDATADMVERNRGFLNAYFVFLSKSLFDSKLRARLSSGADTMLAPIAEALRAIGHVYAYVQRGHGDSGHPALEAISWYRTAEDLEGFLTAMGLRDPPVPPEKIMVEKVLINPQFDEAYFAKPDANAGTISKAN